MCHVGVGWSGSCGGEVVGSCRDGVVGSCRDGMGHAGVR